MTISAINANGINQLNSTPSDAATSGSANNKLDKLIEPSSETKISDMVNHALTTIDASHAFLQKMLNYTGELDVAKLQQTQEELEKFTIGSQLIAKTVSVVVKDIDTLTRIQ